MNISDTLSVDPGRTTLGALHPELATQFLRKRIISRPKAVPHKKYVLDFIFASTAPRPARHGAALLILRLLLAAILIVSGCLTLSGAVAPRIPSVEPLLCGIVEISVGGMLTLGLLTRFSMAAALAAFGFIAVQEALGGVFSTEAFMSVLAALTFFTLGAGKYSCDFLIRKSLILHACRRRRRLKEKRISYQAFRYAATSC